MRNQFFRYLLVIILLAQSACSVAAAASGSKDPDMSKVTTGASRLVIESELGPARETVEYRKGQISWYTYKRGDEPAIGRAALYLIGDIFTFCLLEYVFFPLEISNSGNAYDLIVTYNRADRVTAMREPRANETSLSGGR